VLDVIVTRSSACKTTSSDALKLILFVPAYPVLSKAKAVSPVTLNSSTPKADKIDPVKPGDWFIPNR
jgi:hypothetical protein